ncbi:cupin domain-containing protein [Roseomonas xinghualingensis]|uniref:cupin domain-containing protein n=1 Tax=Roseomonas xinghualingensis TaxID=2986475 RepID=UPI0021F0FDA1|nr:cupin domain-containing protein [Roseomonas sp. SXEYE001]MCV4209255.1 cupin domain-containing protein [Roseomonas sp. SXEYE001]
MESIITKPVAIVAEDAAPRVKPSNYPASFAARMAGRVKRPLGDIFGLRNFGVNLTTLEPGAVSALQHFHSRQDEFIFVLEGEVVLVTGGEEAVLHAGACAGFPADGISHHLENRSTTPVRYLEIGDRTEGDEVSYPADDLVAVRGEGAWRFRRKDGTPY